jgi:integrase
VPLGSEADGWTQAKAENELAETLDQVRRGEWCGRVRAPVDVQTFSLFALEWFELEELRWSHAARSQYRTRLEAHLLPFFGRMTLPEITPRAVDRYIASQSRKRVSEESVRRALQLLSRIMARAVEYELIAVDPTLGRSVPHQPKVPVLYLSSAAQMRALLNAAGAFDAAARRDHQHLARRAVITTFLLSGVHTGELLRLRWKDVDLDSRVLLITGNSARRIDLLPRLSQELERLKEERLTKGLRVTRNVEPGSLVFVSAEGTMLRADNMRNRILRPAIKRANVELSSSGDPPIPSGLTPRGLRHTWASILFELGFTLPAVRAQLGDLTPASTLRWQHPVEADGLREFVGLG